MIVMEVKEKKGTKTGYTTGTCAAAAAKAATWMLLFGKRKEKIKTEIPDGKTVELAVREITVAENSVSCAIKKNSGDDPDITDGMLVFAEVERICTAGIEICGGKGIGTVTKKGLDQPVGAAAINSVPRRMIAENAEQVCRAADYKGGLRITISAPEGELLAKKTFNPRLGIVGGISILGTTGIVEPMSEKALVDTIRVELNQRRECGEEYVLLTPGNYGADFIKANISSRPDCAVLTSNFIGETLDICRELGFKGAVLCGHIGKLVKLAGGMLNTHSRYGDCRMEILAAYAGASGLDGRYINEILNCAVCDDAIRILKENGVFLKTMEAVAERIAFILNRGEGTEFGAVVFSKEYGILTKTKNSDRLLGCIERK